MTIFVTGVTEGGFEKGLGCADIKGDQFSDIRGEHIDHDKNRASNDGDIVINISELPKELKVIRLRVSSY